VNESLLDSVTVNDMPRNVNVPVYVPGKTKVVVPNALLIWDNKPLVTGTVMTPVPLTSGTRKVAVAVCPFAVTVTVRWKSVT
jgi:hypothetical protein